MHARFDDRVFARDDLRIDHHRFRQLNGHTSVHERAALPLPEDAVDFSKVRSRVAAENFAWVRSHMGEHGFALRVQDADRVGQIKFAMLVVRLHLSERRPELFQREAVNRRIDFVNLALLVGELRFFDDGRYQGLGFPNNSAITGRIGEHSGEDRCGRVSLTMHSREGLQRFRANERSIPREYDRKLCPAHGALGHLHGVACAVLRLLQNRDSAERLDEGGYLLRLVADDDHRLPRFQRRAATDNVFDERAPPRAVKHPAARMTIARSLFDMVCSPFCGSGGSFAMKGCR